MLRFKRKLLLIMWVLSTKSHTTFVTDSEYFRRDPKFFIFFCQFYNNDRTA